MAPVASSSHYRGGSTNSFAPASSSTDAVSTSIHPPVRSICCIGAGYVGGPTCSIIAARCPHIEVTIVDVNSARIAAWNSDPDPETGDLLGLPVYEPGLSEVVKQCRGRNLFFSTDIDEAIKKADLIFVSVNTPTKKTGVGAGYAPDLHYVESSTRRIASVATTSKIIVEKSTVPCRTAQSMRVILESNSRPGINFDILSNPEFLAEGTAIRDLLAPDRVLIGGLDTESGRCAAERLSEVYENWVEPERIYTTGLWSSELSKLAANALLAQRISSINSLAAICESTGASVNEVAHACGLDRRIGPHFLGASVGFGGSCFQKDLLNLVYLSESLGLEPVARYWEQVLQMNDWSKKRFARKVVQTMFSTITQKHIALLGFAFKKNTDDTREAPAIDIAKQLLADGGILHIYDPKVPAAAIHAALEGTEGTYIIESSMTNACKDTSAILLITDWDEFSSPTVNWKAIYENMLRPAFIFDGRSVLQNTAALQKIGFKIHRTGDGALEAR